MENNAKANMRLCCAENVSPKDVCVIGFGGGRAFYDSLSQHGIENIVILSNDIITAYNENEGFTQRDFGKSRAEAIGKQSESLSQIVESDDGMIKLCENYKTVICALNADIGTQLIAFHLARLLDMGYVICWQNCEETAQIIFRKDWELPLTKEEEELKNCSGPRRERLILPSSVSAESVSHTYRVCAGVAEAILGVGRNYIAEEILRVSGDAGFLLRGKTGLHLKAGVRKKTISLAGFLTAFDK
ncbi:MAG: hypothetical protein ACI4WS_08205 [Oscillospiraceae bacterium]